MLIENANHAQAQVQLMPFSGMVNPEHMNQINCIPMVVMEEDIVSNNDDDTSTHLENLFIKDFNRKVTEFRETEPLDTLSLPVEIRLGTVYTYQNRRQQSQHPRSLYQRSVSADLLHNEERRPRDDKHFLITFNKNKGINNVPLFEHELTCMGFRQSNEQQRTYRLYLRHQTRRLILELTRDPRDQRFLSVKRLLQYGTKFTHIDVVKSKHQSNYPQTFDDIFDIRTSIGKAADEEELHINDEYCDFLHVKDLDQCVYETTSNNGNQSIYQFNRNLLPFFDFFQIKKTRTYDYSCMDSRFFGVRLFVEQQTGYDLCSSAKTTTPYLETNNVIVAKLLLSDYTEEDAKRIWTIGSWLSDLATRCTSQHLPANKMHCRRPERVAVYRRVVR